MKASDVNILNFISGRNKVFLIPPFQRNYEWTTKHCEELFDDIVVAFRNNKSHYFGNIVYYIGQNSGATFQEFILVDGQQRITTILLLLCALRDLTQDNEILQDIQENYLTNRTSNEKYRIRLKQTAYDADCFISIINGENTTVQNNTVTNYEYFKKRILESDISIRDLYITLEKLEIVDVNLQIDNDLNKVQTVFEKINSTGKSLEPADLIRNYLLIASNINEQEVLYTEYWLKIERALTNDNISRFAKDYLVYILYEDVRKEYVYKTFKKHFDSVGTQHLKILQELLRLSKYYAWLLFENCPDNKINSIIKYLNCLKTNDLYPLYLYLFDNLYERDNVALQKIMNLLSDFMLRYRIVSPSGGGGALRTVIYDLLEKLNSGEIVLTYDSIMEELSNSATPSGRYPDNDEFKRALMDHVDIPYARVAFLKLEACETRNIPVSLSEVTIEHLLPQTRTPWWEDNLGGEEATNAIYEKYLNCIGNLAPISKGYNSSNSNKPWIEKLINLRSVQFAVTSEISQFAEWKEKDLKKRNSDIANRICKAVSGPLKRSRPYQSRSTGNNISGVIALSDLDVSVTGASIKYLIYDGKVIVVDTWRDLFLETCKVLESINHTLLVQLATSNEIHKATSSRNFPHKDPVITCDQSKVVDAREICNTSIYVEGCFSAERARFYARQFAEKFDVLDKFSIELITSE